jgi:chromosome segregation ATPase
VKEHKEEVDRLVSLSKNSTESLEAGLKQEIVRLNLDLANALDGKEAITQEAAALKDDFEKTSASLKARIVALEDINNQLEASIASERNKISELNEATIKSDAEIEGLKTENETLRKNLQAEQAKIRTLEVQLGAKSEEVDQLGDKLEIEKETHSSECKLLKDKADELEGLLEEKDVELRHYMENCLEKDQLESQNVELKSEKDRLALELQNQLNFSEVLKAELKKARGSLVETEELVIQKDKDFEAYRQSAVMETAELNSSVKAEFDKVVSNIKAKDVDIDRLKGLINQLESEREVSKDSLLKERSSGEALQKAVQQKEEELAKLTQTSKDSLAEKTKEINRLSNTQAGLQKQLAASNDKLEDLDKEIKCKDDTIKDLKTEILSLENQINNNAARIAQLEAAAVKQEEEHKQKLAKAVNERNEVEELYTEELSQVIEEKEKFKSEAEMSRKDIYNKDMEILRLKQLQEDLQIESQQRGAQIERLNKELQSKIVDTGGVLKAKDKFISQLEAKIKSQEEDMERFNSEIMTRERKLQLAEAEFEAMNTNIQTLTENLDNLASQNQQVTTQLRDVQEENRGLKRDLAVANENLKQEKNVSERNLELSNNKSASIENLKKEIERQTSDYRTLEESYRKEKDITRTQAQVLTSKDTKLSELSSQIMKLNAEIEQEKHKISEFEKRIHDLETALSLSSSKISSQSAKITALEKQLNEDREKRARQEGLVKEREEGVEFMRQSLERERMEREKDKKSWESEIEKLSETVTKEKRKREWIEDEKEKLETLIKKLELEAKQTEITLNDLEEEMKSKDEDLARMKADLDTLASRGTELEEALEEAIDQRDQQKEVCTQTMFENSQLELKLQETKNRLAEVDTLFEQIEVLKDQCEMLNLACQEKEETITELNTKTVEQDLVNEKLVARMNNMQEEMQLMDEQVQEAEDKVTKAEESLNKVITERNIEREEKKALKVQLEKTQKDLSSHGEREQDLERRLRESKEELKIRNTEIEVFEKKLKEANEMNGRFTATIRDFQLKYTEMQREKESKSKEVTELKKELELVKQKECKELEKIKSEINSADLEKSELGGRLKELSTTVENYRVRLESEKDTSAKLKFELEKQAGKLIASEKLVEKIKQELDTAVKNPKLQYREQDANLLWKKIALKCQVAKLRQRYVATLIVVTKSRSYVKRAKQLEKENTKLAEELMVQTKKLIMNERNRSEMEDQLNQLDQVMMVSKTLKSETDQNVSARELTTEGRRNTEGRAQQQRLVLRDLLKIIQELLNLEMPPLDNLNDRMWDSYAPKFKSKLTEKLIQLDAEEEMKAQYIATIDLQNQECEKLKEELRLKQLGK